MEQVQLIPDTLDSMPPGPELCAVLASLDRTRLVGCDVVVLLRARARQVAYEQAQLLADAAEVAVCETIGLDQTTNRATEPGKYAAEEIAAALTWTVGTAEAQLWFGWAIFRLHPSIGAAMLTGEIDYARANVISEGVAGLDEATARLVVQRILPRAGRLTSGRLRAALAKLVISVDPDAADKRYRKGVKDRRVEHGLQPDGTANLYGLSLPAERAAAAQDRLTRLADALKRSGDERSLDQLRADVLLDLLQGLPISLIRTDLTGGGGPDAPGGGAGQSTVVNTDLGGLRSGADDVPSSAVGATSRGGVELTVPLATLMRLAHRPGELAGGWGPVIADIARQLAEQQAVAPWRFSVTDKTGRVIAHGRTSRRPSDPDAALVKARDRRCRFPSCRRPARGADLDHTVDWQHGGPSIPENLGVLCRRHRVTRMRREVLM